MKVKYSLNWEFIMSRKRAKTVFFAKSEGTDTHRTMTRWFKKVCSGVKNFDDETRSDRLLNLRPCCKPGRKIRRVASCNSSYFLPCEYQARSASQSSVQFITFTTSANLECGPPRVSGEIAISQFSPVHYIHNLVKSGVWHSENIRRDRHLTVQCGSFHSWSH